MKRSFTLSKTVEAQVAKAMKRSLFLQKYNKNGQRFGICNRIIPKPEAKRSEFFSSIF